MREIDVRNTCFFGHEIVTWQSRSFALPLLPCFSLFWNDTSPLLLFHKSYFLFFPHEFFVLTLFTKKIVLAYTFLSDFSWYFFDENETEFLGQKRKRKEKEKRKLFSFTCLFSITFVITPGILPFLMLVFFPEQSTNLKLAGELTFSRYLLYPR